MPKKKKKTFHTRRGRKNELENAKIFKLHINLTKRKKNKKKTKNI